MKRTLLAIFSSAILATPAFALVGGPFDNNIFFGNDMASTYQGTITGKNTSGIMIFGTASGSAAGQGSSSQMGTFGSAGRALVFYKGYMIVSDVTAIGDFEGRKLVVALDGSITFPNVDKATKTTVITNTKTTTKAATDTTPAETTTETTQTKINDTYTLDGAIMMSGVIDARFVRTFPNIEYSGKGELEFSGALDLRREFNYVTGSWEPTGGVIGFYDNVDVRINGVRTANSSPTIVGTLTSYIPEVTKETTRETP